MDLPIFPLPELVLFPDVVIPLHIFEPRYQRLISDLLKKKEESRLLALTTITGPSNSTEFDDAPFHYIGTLCKLIDYKELPDGRSDVFVHAVSTVTIDEINFLDTTTPYRRAIVKPIDPDWKIEHEFAIKDRVLKSLENYTSIRRLEIVDLDKLKLREMVNLLSYALPLSVDQKFKLLEKPSLQERVDLLINLMDVKYELVDFSDKYNEDSLPIN
ncbi:MAG: LON peptidase substrate-binding domain-containing protein [Candidatus Heimdallarchaeota archaeon]|nr:LON peptidase substrate-binding domain-containing protein [Candidatus Heimdallarchaeota archaeon]